MHRLIRNILAWAVHLIRWKQTNEIGYLPNKRMPHTFMAVTHDLYGIKGDAHEREKQPWIKRIIPGTRRAGFKVQNLELCSSCYRIILELI